MTRRSRNASAEGDNANQTTSVLRRIFVQRRHAPSGPPSTAVAARGDERLNGSFTVQMPATADRTVQFAPLSDAPAPGTASNGDMSVGAESAAGGTRTGTNNATTHEDWTWGADEQTSSTSASHGTTVGDHPNQSTPFPGGRARLPRLDGSDISSMSHVGAAFVRPAASNDRPAAENPRSGFEEYFTFESLFEEVPEPGSAAEEEIGDPYRILGVRPTATWPEVQAAHRRLVKEFHPDRFAGHDPETIRRAEEEIRRINWAYGQLEQGDGPARAM